MDKVLLKIYACLYIFLQFSPKNIGEFQYYSYKDDCATKLLRLRENFLETPLKASTEIKCVIEYCKWAVKWKQKIQLLYKITYGSFLFSSMPLFMFYNICILMLFNNIKVKFVWYYIF